MKKKKTMTDLLREALLEAKSFNSVAKETGLIRHSLMRFARGEQSLRLDLADRLAEHFGIECHRIRRKDED